MLDDRAAELDAALTVTEQWTHAEPNFKQLTGKQLDARLVRVRSKCDAEHARADHYCERDRDRYDPEREETSAVPTRLMPTSSALPRWRLRAGPQPRHARRKTRAALPRRRAVSRTLTSGRSGVPGRLQPLGLGNATTRSTPRPSRASVRYMSVTIAVQPRLLTEDDARRYEARRPRISWQEIGRSRVSKTSGRKRLLLDLGNPIDI